MVDLALRTQGEFPALLEALNSVILIAIVILFAPTFVSLFTRKWVTIASTSVLNTACLTLLATGQSSSSAGPLAIVTISAALMIALFGLHGRQLWQNLSGLERRLGMSKNK